MAQEASFHLLRQESTLGFAVRASLRAGPVRVGVIERKPPVFPLARPLGSGQVARAHFTERENTQTGRKFPSLPDIFRYIGPSAKLGLAQTGLMQIRTSPHVAIIAQEQPHQYLPKPQSTGTRSTPACARSTTRDYANLEKLARCIPIHGLSPSHHACKVSRSAEKSDLSVLSFFRYITQSQKKRANEPR